MEVKGGENQVDLVTKGECVTIPLFDSIEVVSNYFIRVLLILYCGW